MTCVAKVRRLQAESFETQPRVCCAVRRKIVPVLYQPETTDLLTDADMDIAADDTVYLPSTIYQFTGIELWTRIDTLFINWKNRLGLPLHVNNLDTKFIYAYLRIGGTATRHKLNGVNPALYVGQYFGGWTHDGGGSTPNGTTGYFDTNCYAATELPIQNVGGFIDLKQSNGNFEVEICADDGSRGAFLLFFTSATSMTTKLSQATPAGTDTTVNAAGVFSMNRELTSEYKTKDGATLLSTQAIAYNPPTMSQEDIIEGAYGNSVGSAFFSTKRRTIHAAGTFTHTELDGIIADWQTFETSMNR